MSTKNKTNKLLLNMFATFLFCYATLFSATYDDTYSPLNDENSSQLRNDNKFMQGDFQEIVRFESLYFDDEEICRDSRDGLNQIIAKIKSYQDIKRDIMITVIGHTNALTDDANEATVSSGTYAKVIESWFSDSLKSADGIKISKNYALSVKKLMVDNNISDELIEVENRSGTDLAYSDFTSKGKQLSNRVMVTMYVAQSPDADLDGVFDYKDKCPKTPRGVLVDDDGCALDADKDGVPDYKDICANTPPSLQVDFQGCRLNDTLALTFKTDSDEILPVSDPIIADFAKFLNDNKGYDAEIVGHTDDRASEAHNMDLSQRRALSTKKKLVEAGIDESRLTTKGFGELDPVATNETEEGRQLNRRIEVNIFFRK